MVQHPLTPRKAALNTAFVALKLISTCHAADLYRYLIGLASVSLFFTAYMAPLKHEGKVGALGGSFITAMMARSMFEFKAKQDARVEQLEREGLEDHDFDRYLDKERLKTEQDILLEASFRHMEVKAYEDLPLWAHPQRKAILETSEKKDPMADLFKSLQDGLEKAMGDAPDEVDRPTSNSQPQLLSDQTGIPIIDLAGEMATSSMSILIAAMTRTGKSVLIRNAIAAKVANQPETELYLFNGKNGTVSDPVRFLGIERTNRYQLVTDEEHIPEFVGSMGGLRGFINDETYETPTIIVCDEYNNIRDAIDDYDKRNDTKMLEGQDSTAKRIVTQGAFKDYSGWFTSHSPNVEDVGLNGANAKNMAFISLGRGPRYWSAIERMLDPKFKPMPEQDRKRLLAQFESYRDKHGQDESRVLAITNLVEGRWMLIQLPQYETFPSDIDVSRYRQTSTTQLMQRNRPPAQTRPQAPTPAPKQPESTHGFKLSEDDKKIAISLFGWLKTDGGHLRQPDGWYDVDMICHGWRDLELPRFNVLLEKLRYAGLVEIQTVTEGRVERPGKFRRLNLKNG